MYFQTFHESNQPSTTHFPVNKPISFVDRLVVDLHAGADLADFLNDASTGNAK